MLVDVNMQRRMMEKIITIIKDTRVMQIYYKYDHDQGENAAIMIQNYTVPVTTHECAIHIRSR